MTKLSSLAAIFAAVLFCYWSAANNWSGAGSSGQVAHPGIAQARLATFEDGQRNWPWLLPSHDLPDRKVIQNLSDLERLKLVNRELVLPPESRPWSSSGFPAMLGGVAGRWQDSAPTLVWRSLTGFDSPDRDSIRSQLAAANWGKAAQRYIERLSPTEKLDLAIGDYDFTGTNAASLALGHNRPSLFREAGFWWGYCDGAAVAATLLREPAHEVTVLNPNEYPIRFFPEDIKALLAMEHVARHTQRWALGSRCDDSQDGRRTCQGINAATLFIALANRIGSARKSFVIDFDPGVAVLNMAVRSTRLSLLEPPIASNDSRFANLVRVRIEIDAASTLSSSEWMVRQFFVPGYAESPEPGVVRFSYEAVLGLDHDLKIIGGGWYGNTDKGPDVVWGHEAEKETALDSPALQESYLHYPESLVDSLYALSIKPPSLVPRRLVAHTSSSENAKGR